MSIANKVAVNTYYTRSINIERDLNSADVIKSYIPTSRAVRTLSRVAESFNQDTTPRAWSLIGPYGSGKSSFSLYLNHVLGNPDNEATQTAYDLLAIEPQLLQQYKAVTERTKGFMKVLISGAPEPLSKRLVQGMANAAIEFWKDIKSKKPAVIEKLKTAAEQTRIENNVVIELIKELQKALANKSKGLLLVIDELGKFLEYEARHYEANDVFLLQTIAEHGCKGNDVNVYLFVLLHQSFEQYAKGLGEALKKEWAKIQGRFEDIPFLEGTEQTLKVVAKAFKYQLDDEQNNIIQEQVSGVVSVLDKENALPGVMNQTAASELFANCYPLHPVTALILPYICQKVAQNERTLFSFLGSQEPFGLKKLISEFEHIGEWVMPHHIFDYFITNQPAALGDHITQRRWAEVMSAIDRLVDAKSTHLNFLKSVGLFNIIGAQSGLKASKLILASLYGENGSANMAADLTDKAVLQYRQFNSEYRVWQGSDFDLESAVQDQLDELGKFSLATVLNKRAQLKPIVARRYTIETGAFRYFIPTFVDAQTYKDAFKIDDEPRIIFYLATGKDDEEMFHNKVKKHFGELDIVALYMNAPSLKEATAQVEALNRVRINCQELNNDNVAYKEFGLRADAAMLVEAEMLRSLTDKPEELLWFDNKQQLTIGNKRQLQVALSHHLKTVYSQSPVIKNELINRDKPSSQAKGASSKLLVAMLQNSKLENLGFEKNPPEKAIYNAFVKAVGIHSQDADGDWLIAPPPLEASKDKLNFRHVWLRVKKFIETTQVTAKSLTDLEQELIRPPYGIKAGLLPIIYVSAMLVYKDSLAVYLQRQFRPELTGEDIERFIKRPDEYTVQFFKLEGLNESIFSQYNKALYGIEGVKTAAGKDRKLLSLAKPLTKFIEVELPAYTQQTKDLSDEALKLREAFKLSKSPLTLIFKEIPKALGFKELAENDESKEQVEGLAKKLTDALRELKYTHKNLLERQVELLGNAFNIKPQQNEILTATELRKLVYGKLAGLENFTIDESGVKAFIKRLVSKADNDDQWLESVLLFLGHKPTQKWTDKDKGVAEYRLSKFAKQILDLHTLWVQDTKNKQKNTGDLEVILLRTVKPGQGEVDEVVTIDNNMRDAIGDVQDQIEQALDGIKGNSELQLAALAEVVNKYLVEFKGTKSTNIDTDVDIAKGA